MVGLSVVLESSLRNNNNNNITTNGKYCNNNSKNNNAQVINKLTIMKKHSQPPCKGSFPDTGFLDRCFLCSKKLLAGKDIYMYKGDTAFCSMECRSNQILMDEEEINYNKSSAFKRDNCSFSVIKGPNQSSSSSSSSKHNHKGKSSRNGANGFVF